MSILCTPFPKTLQQCHKTYHSSSDMLSVHTKYETQHFSVNISEWTLRINEHQASSVRLFKYFRISVPLKYAGDLYQQLYFAYFQASLSRWAFVQELWCRVNTLNINPYPKCSSIMHKVISKQFASKYAFYIETFK